MFDGGRGAVPGSKNTSVVNKNINRRGLISVSQPDLLINNDIAVANCCISISVLLVSMKKKNSMRLESSSATLSGVDMHPSFG